MASSIDGAERPIIALTVGDPAGIGPEIVVKALTDTAMYDCMRPLVYADQAVLSQTLEMLGESMTLNAVERPSDGRYTYGCLDFVDVGAVQEPIAYGEVSAMGGTAG